MRSNMLNKNMNAEFPVMLQLLGNINNQKLLDLGCGFGDYTKVYSECDRRESIGLIPLPLGSFF